MLNINRRHHRSKRGQRRGRFESTVTVQGMRVRGGRGKGLFGARRRVTRSQVRLKSRARPSFREWVASLAPARAALRLNWNALFNVLVLGALGWLLAWLFLSDRFYVSRVTVIGNHRVASKAVVAASGLQGYSIFWVDPRAVATQVVESLPPVRRVRVRYSLPNRVSLIVEEEGDQVMWEVAGRRYWVDDAGELHPAIGDAEPALVVRDIRPGLPARVDVDAVVAARQLVHLMPEVKVLEYAPITGLRFTHRRGWVVYLGVGDDMARKVSILRALEARFAAQDAPQPSLVDLRFPDSPYYRLPDGEGGT